MLPGFISSAVKFENITCSDIVSVFLTTFYTFNMF